MDQKSKPVTTSVPSISIKFHANVEEIEELYASEDETTNTSLDKTLPRNSSANTISNIGEPDTSPLRYLPRLAKRSTSIDVSSTSNVDSSPPSDPWKFFSGIKGKITKSVEGKITEIKARNQEEGSPLHKPKTELKIVKDSKESSSVSDSEEFSESSISKTCGIISTTEGAEMSSDEDTPSLEKEKDKKLPSSIRQRFLLLRNKASSKEGTVNFNNLAKLYNINTEKTEQALPDDSEDVESAVDALDEANFKNGSETSENKINNEDILKKVVQKFDNIEINKENVLTIKEVTGKEIRESFFDGSNGKARTVFAPTGFVDLRPRYQAKRPFFNNFTTWIVFVVSITLYYLLQSFSSYLAGLITGLILALIAFKIFSKLYPSNITMATSTTSLPLMTNKIMEIPAVKEYQPLTKYEGWANEYPDIYDPATYHISQTQSVFLRLQGNLLRISHSKSKVAKRAMWNEPDNKTHFTHQRIYNLLGGKIHLLPEGLTRKRFWSKKYPICITLDKDQMNFDPAILKIESEDELLGDKQSDKASDKDKSSAKTPKEKKRFTFRKKEYPVLAQRFSKLTEDEEFDLESDSRASSPSPDISDVPIDEQFSPAEGVIMVNNEQNNDDINSLPDDWSIYSQSLDESPTDVKIYIFGRTDREKEDWFRRLAAATHKGANIVENDNGNQDIKDNVSEVFLETLQTEADYVKYMSLFNKVPILSGPSKKQEESEKDSEKPEPESSDQTDDPKSEKVLWLNALIGRVLFDCMRDPNFSLKVGERIQRKLQAIKLPYFIEELLITELSLGKTPPFVRRVGKPLLDERGLWVDLDIAYEGLIVLTLQTKLNLMKLKNPHAHEKLIGEIKSAIYHSDVDDSAESSSDEEGSKELPNLPQEVPGGSSNSSKKFIKMVDRIAESKFFQAATENRYIKKAMEGVSNTDLRLTVEVKGIAGTLVLNIPPPPSDRVWVGFRPIPEVILTARPIVGERNISYMMVTSWIEKKLLQEFQKIMVIPNMEDFVIPVMNQKLPE